MPVIYEPRGKAREYSPLACNLYMGCTHGCRYCYAPGALGKRAADYFSTPHPRKGILRNMESELKGNVITRQIMLSFVGDVYCETADEGQTTRGALEILLAHGARVAVLTKGGGRCLRDMDLFKRFEGNIMVGATLTFWDEGKSRLWERGAADPADRIAALKTLKSEGVRTFASFEPVIEPKESLWAMKMSLDEDCVDIYKIGKLNNYMGLDKNVDWAKFLELSLKLLRPTGKRIYIKHDLRQAAPGILLSEAECRPVED